MNTHHQQELSEVLGTDDAVIGDLLLQHKTRRNDQIDHQARNLSVHVAQRLQRKRPGRSFILAGLATSAAAALVVFALSTTTQTPDAGTSATAAVAAVVHQQTTSMGSATNGIRSEQGCVNIVNVQTKRVAPRPASPSDERILEQEAERQVVDYLASVLVDEDTWSVDNQDIDRLLQENGNDAGL